jgi:membrane protein implicated in regulation of membrane protease activity
MNQQLWTIVWLSLYFLLFVAAMLGIALWRVKRRRERPPVEFKLLRGPGESLRQRMNKFDEDFIFLIGAAAMVPVAAGILVLSVLIWLTPHMPLRIGLAIVAAVVAPLIYFAGRWAYKSFLRTRDDRLGYLGERAVGEALFSLIGDGYRIFHDVPAEANKSKFNVDHVAVGPNGLFAIETKCRRKGRARPGYEDYKVAYNGRQLDWPWGEDSFGLKNAEDRARWLSEMLNRLTRLGLAAQPVLVLPGWFIVPKGVGRVIVANDNTVCDAILRCRQDVFTDVQVDRIARLLDPLCRDVED